MFLTLRTRMACRAKRAFRVVFQRLRQNSILILWLILIVLVYWSAYSKYMHDPKYFYLRQMLGMGLLLSRAMAAVINVGCFMVIIPMCRCFTTYIRVLGSKVSAKLVLDWIDASRKFHVICAFTILFAGVFHSIAHAVNAMNFSKYFNPHYADINVARFRGEAPLTIVIATVPGVTGVLMLIILFVLSAAAMKYIRNVNYELFWYSHHLFILFYFLLVSHPMSGLLKEQINTSSHPPGCHMNSSYILSMLNPSEYVICEEVPIFVSQKSMTWLWVSAGFTIYVIDLGFRLFRRRCHVTLLSAVLYKPNILCLTLTKENFSAKPGQYIYVQCPYISILEWHPFSISQCPTEEDPSFTLHLRADGDWSESLKQHLFSNDNAMSNNDATCEIKFYDLFATSPDQRLLIDGPYSSCFEDVFQYSVSVCIAGGIGITPFASILSCMRINNKSLHKIKRLHLIWMCREVEIFGCFADLLSEVFKLVWDANKPDKFEFHLYLTKEHPWNAVDTVLQNSSPFLKPRIQLGRPRWNELFKNWAEIYKKSDVGVFSCGPRPLNHDIRRQCNLWNSRGCHFKFHQETFS